MPWGLKRYQHTNQTHFITFSCYRRMRLLQNASTADLFLFCLEQTRRRFQLRVYGYVVMPEHVHLLLSEPERSTLSAAIHSLKLAVSKRVRNHIETERPFRFWHSRYFDFNVQSNQKFAEKLRYMHRNPVERGLVEKPDQWHWSSFRHYSDGELGVVEIESERTAQKQSKNSHPTT
jgi:putative transposase